VNFLEEKNVTSNELLKNKESFPRGHCDEILCANHKGLRMYEDTRDIP
jgi:hypothetical protein